ncbi:nucleoprotein TPR isoform X6 [Mastacembelus armatus]|uniref:nucleoprotein TPR isoform X6 n=1 Tax=Mastacembelus armatus TaxID=205130 RepID=UPI000E45E2D4|nr:nucleoprotein TPR-like isoform X6 [Mastacembelus armatus]
MGTQGTGRKRSTKKERATAEDDALNLIAREAEARLAAKRAARAEAREIRMKELERQQKEIFQVQKKYYGLNTKLDDRADSKWGDIEQWMEDSEKYSRSSQIRTLSDDDERMSVGSRGSVRSDLEAAGAYGGGGSFSHKKSKKKKKHKHKDRDRNGYDDDYSVMSSRCSGLSDESRLSQSRSSRLDLTSSRLSDDSRVSRASRLDLQPASHASSDLYSLSGLSSTRNPGSALNGYQSSLYDDSLCSGSQRVTGSSAHPLEYTNYRNSSSRASSRASSACASPVDNCSSVASYLRCAAGNSGLPGDLDDVTIPDFSDQVEDRDYLEKGSRAASALTAATLTSLGGTSSRRGSGETAITVDAETSIREIKEIHELKDQIQDVESKYTQNLKEVKDALAELEEKYRKAMVSNAQLDNEKNNLMYQVDTLKDSLMELEELLSESRQEYVEKVKEYEREKHAHNVLQFQFSEMKEMLKQSEELLNETRQLRMKQEGFIREICDLQETLEWKDKKIGALERQKEYTDAIRIERDELREEVVKLKDILKKHGIVLGPDLNINGDVGEAEVDGSPSGDSATNSAQDSQTFSMEGNNMLGNTEENQLRSSGEEGVAPEQHQEMLKEEDKEIHLTSDTLCNVPDVSTLETSKEKQPTEQTCIPTEGDSIEEHSHSKKDLNVYINEHLITEAKDVIVCPKLVEIVSSAEENILETETSDGGALRETTNPDLRETENISGSVDTHNNDIRETYNKISEEQGNKQEDVESNLRNTEACPQQRVAEDVTKKSLPNESISAVSKTDTQQEPENAEEAENEETEEISQPQGITASGKKKKKKRRGKKKGGTQENKNRQKDETEKENSKTEKGMELIRKDNGLVTEPETLKESEIDQIKNEQEMQETEGVDAVKVAEPSETEPRMGHDGNEKEQSLETEIVKEAPAESPEASLSVSDLIDRGCTGPDTECIFRADNFTIGDISINDEAVHRESENMGLKVESIHDLKPGSTSDHSEIILEQNSKVNTEAEAHVPNSDDVSADQSEFTNTSERKDSLSVSLPKTDISTDGLKNLSASELLSERSIAETSVSSDTPPIKVSARGPEEATETIKDDEEPRIETEPECFPTSVISLSHVGDDNSELKQDRTEKEVPTRSTEQPEDLVKTDSSSHEGKRDSCNSAMLMTNTELDEKSLLETVTEAEPFHNVESQTLVCVDYMDQSNVEADVINTSEVLNTPDSPREATEIGSSDEQESTVAKVLEHKINPNDQESETSLCPLTEQLHESIQIKSEDNESSQPTQQDSDEEDGEDEEGQSFDFDDMDIEVAVAADLPKNPEQDDIEEGTAVISDDGNIESSALCQSNTEINENAQGKSGESNEENCTADGSSQTETLDKESNNMPQDNQNSSAHEEATSEKGENVCEEVHRPKEEVVVADEARHIVQEGNVFNVGELGAVAENINLPVEEGLDAVRHEEQGEDVVLSKGAEEVASSKESPQSGKDVKKNGKKGKGKSKEEYVHIGILYGHIV